MHMLLFAHEILKKMLRSLAFLLIFEEMIL